MADTVKKTSTQAIREMQKMGLSVVMLTGDHEKTAKAIQRELGIERVVAEVLPQDKEKEVRRLQAEGHKVAMVGRRYQRRTGAGKSRVGLPSVQEPGRSH